MEDQRRPGHFQFKEEWHTGCLRCSRQERILLLRKQDQLYEPGIRRRCPVQLWRRQLCLFQRQDERKPQRDLLKELWHRDYHWQGWMDLVLPPKFWNPTQQGKRPVYVIFLQLQYASESFQDAACSEHRQSFPPEYGKHIPQAEQPDVRPGTMVTEQQGEVLHLDDVSLWTDNLHPCKECPVVWRFRSNVLNTGQHSQTKRKRLVDNELYDSSGQG